MKIIFLCGSLEPGRDGVGDYVRRLAGEMIRQGHQVSVVALNDQHLISEFIGTQSSEGFHLSVLRVPSIWSAKQRMKRVKGWINDFNPELLSLQFVIFSFDPNGLPFNLNKQLASISKSRTWHIMFHELWVGMATHSSFKHILWGWVQRVLIKSLVNTLKPRIIHTQTWLYQKQLANLGVDASFLPIFSNINILQNCNNLDEQKLVRRDSHIKLVVFGSIHSYSQVEALVKEIDLFIKRSGLQVTLQAIGRCGPELERWIALWNSAGLSINVLGEQSSENISKVLKESTIGITTTALPMIQKSGTVAAMREHGLSVICIAKPWKPRGIKVLDPPAGIYIFQEGILQECLETKKINKCSSHSLSKITSQFMKAVETPN